MHIKSAAQMPTVRQDGVSAQTGDAEELSHVQHNILERTKEASYWDLKQHDEWTRVEGLLKLKAPDL
jgi:hypothetical protein